MEYIQILLLSTFLFFSIRFLFTKSKPTQNLPPSPGNSLPVIGHLHLMKRPFHRKLLSFSKSLGNAPIFHIRFGDRQVYVISSRAIAEECFTKNDLVLANRPLLMINKHLGYNATHMIGASYGDHWRSLRRITASEIFSSLRLSMFSYVRKDEIRRLLSRLTRHSLHGFVEVEMKSLFTNLAFNNIIRIIAGKRYYGDDTEDEDEAKFVKQLVSEVLAGDSGRNPADHLSFLRWFTDSETRIKDVAHRFDAFLQKLVDEKRAEKEKSKTMIDHLLSLQETQPDCYTDVIIKGIILDLIVAGTDTVSITLEWALSNLLNHQEILKKARIEIDEKIGLDRLVDEPDIVNLLYLQNIILETLRLYPPAPLLLPHLSSEDCQVGGYDMPRGTMLLMNVWAMHRDPVLWEESERFNPERFDKEGEAQKIMPFGLGRRACPGSGLAHRLVGLALASLVQCFEWERIGIEQIDMREGKGVTMPKKVPLRAMCKARVLPAYSLPFIGHLHLLKHPVHRTLLSLSKSLGNTPIFHLRLGNRLVYVVSSHSIAEECFTRNDVVLANRPELLIGKHVAYNSTIMISASYGDHWRNLRRIAAVEVFSSHRVSTFMSIRKDEIRRLITHLSGNSLHGFVEVEMKSLLGNLAFNNIIMMVAGKRYYGGGTEDNDEAKVVRELISEGVAGAGAGNLADYLPIIRWVTDFEKRAKLLGIRFDNFLQGLVDEKRAEKEKDETLIHHLLSLQKTQPEYYTDVIIKGMILSLVIAGTDTSAVTLEWALSNLMNHPEILKKARAEIDDKIGLERLIEESDITNLPYLQNIVSETLRLYPAVPLLLPHFSSDDCKVAGYDMPRGTILLTNAWAMHRDPGLWEEPDRFKPERFEKEGEAQKLMPFGMGRRACPGAELGKRLVSLALGCLIQCFEWKRVDEELVDMTEEKGITMPKATPLRAMCKSRIVARKMI